MGFFDWLLTDPTQRDGGFLARLLPGYQPGDTMAGPVPLADGGSGSLLGEAPLINLLRSGFAGMDAANGYSGFGSQFAAGVKGGADAMALRRQQMMDQIKALKLRQALQENVGANTEDDKVAAGGAATCAQCNGASSSAPADTAQFRQSAPRQVSGLPRVQSDADYLALPGGTQFIDPFGRIKVKP